MSNDTDKLFEIQRTAQEKTQEEIKELKHEIINQSKEILLLQKQNDDILKAMDKIENSFTAFRESSNRRLDQVEMSGKVISTMVKWVGGLAGVITSLTVIFQFFKK